MKTEITEAKNNVAISKGYPDWETFENWIIDNSSSCDTAIQVVSAMEEVITELRKPSEENREKIKELLWSFSCDATVNPEKVLDDIIWLCSRQEPRPSESETGWTDEELVQKIEKVIDPE